MQHVAVITGSTALAIGVAFLATAVAGEAPSHADVAVPVRAPAAQAAPTPAPIAVAPHVDGFALDPNSGVYVADTAAGHAVLTLDPALQARLQTDLDRGMPQWGASVVIDLATGAVLALAEHSEREPQRAGAGRRPLGKAASVFKIVTASALLRKGVSPSAVACGSGGKTRLSIASFADHPGRAERCVRLEDAVPLSQNVAIAKLAGRYLTPQDLAAEAARFGFGAPVALDLDMPPSTAAVPQDDFLAFAKTAAGFGEVRLSALHGALLAAAVGTGGLLPKPHIVASLNGATLPVPEPERVLDEESAAVLQGMLTATVTRGTATRGLSTPKEAKVYRSDPTGPVRIPVAGKTGSLTDRDVSLDTSWFVGTAPAHHPRVAFAVVIINDEWIWHVRALEVARRLLVHTFDAHPEWAAVQPAVAQR